MCRSILRAMSLALLLCVFASCAYALDARAQKYYERRLCSFHVEGMALDDIAIGARGKLTLLYVDKKLGAAIQKMGTSSGGAMADERARFLLNYTGRYAERKGQTLFTVMVESFKNWDYDTHELVIAGHAPEKGDLVTGVLGKPEYELRPGVTPLPGDYWGLYSVFVPSDLLAPGSEIEISYGEWSTTWTVPKKDE